MKKFFLGIATFVMLTVICVISAGAETYGDYEYIVQEDGTIEIIAYSGSDEVVNIPEKIDGIKVTSIWAYAFESNEHITSVIIPDGVTNIGEYAFAHCSSLVSINIPDSVTTLGAYAFNEAPLLSVEEDEILYIGKFLLKCGSAVTDVTVKNGTIHIYEDAFADCYSLVSVTMPDSVVSIGERAFMWCNSLETIKLSSNLESIGRDAFSFNMSLVEIALPDSLTEICDYAFYYCESLKKITIPANVSYIGYAAFGFCSSLEEIEVNSANKFYIVENNILFSKDKTEIISYPAYNTEATYTIPDSVTKIADYAFAGASFTSVTIPNGVNYIGAGAFESCCELTSVVIPEGITIIPEYAFSWCYSLESVTLPKSLLSIGLCAFLDCSSLDSITIPDNVTYIGDSAFSYCSSLTAITIPQKVEEIAVYAFYNCPALTRIYVPESVTTIGYRAFGYGYNFDTGEDVKVEGQGIWCFDHSVAMEYAIESDIPYNLLKKDIDSPVLSATSGNKQVTLNWTAVDGASYYQIIRYNKGTYTLIANISSTSAVVKGLTNNFEYTYLIKAVAPYSVTSFSNAVNVTPLEDLPKPVLSAVAGDKEAKLSWTAASGASYYQIIRYNKGTYSLVANISGTSATVKGLANNFEYTYLIKAVAADGRTSFSNAINVTPVASSKPVLTAMAGDKQAHLSWTAVSGAKYYQIIRYNKGTYTFIANIAGTTATVKSLANNYEYTYLIKVIMSDGTVAYTNAVNVTPKA